MQAKLESLLRLFFFCHLKYVIYFLAIIDLDKSLTEVESILDVKNEFNFNKSNNRNSQIIEEEIERLRKLLNYAQDFSLVKKRATEYTNKQIQTYSVDEDLLEICNASELEATNYDNVMDTVYNNRFGDDDDYDSENDSFASAAESVDLEVCFSFFVFF